MSVVEAARERGVTLAWAKILAKVNPDILKKPGKRASQYKSTWASSRRKLAHIHPDVMVPNRVRLGDPTKKGEGNKKPFIVLALDQSGSISSTWAQKMLALAMSVPKDLIEVEACTFSTIAIPFDLTPGVHNEIASGGTSFSCVEEFVRGVAKKRGSYPSAVICITDGAATFRNSMPNEDQLKENWTWLLLSPDDAVHDGRVPFDTIHFIGSFL